MPLLELQRRILYAIVVAGKSATFTNAVMERLLEYCWPSELPFNMLRRYVEVGNIRDLLLVSRTGNYGKVERAFTELVRSNINLETCGPDELEQIHGIGPKTSRFFILWTRPDARYAALDVHVLRWMRALGYPAPHQTPTGDRYRRLELIFLEEADRRGMTPAALDQHIWALGSKKIS